MQGRRPFRLHRRRLSLEDDDDSLRTKCCGWLLLIATLLFFAAIVYMLVVSKLLPPTGHWLLDWVREDTYYCLLVPNTIVVTVFTIYLNWLGLKFFRHN